MILTYATAADLPRLVQFRTDAATWLSALGSDQWALPFPAEHIAQSIAAGEVYVLREAADAEPAATITLDREADPLLWTETERAEPALYVHKLTVDRQHAGHGLGARLLDCAGGKAAAQGARWLRLDAWSTNPALHRYYELQGFQHVRTVLDPEVGGSGWVAQRPAAPAEHGFTDLTDNRGPGEGET